MRRALRAGFLFRPSGAGVPLARAGRDRKRLAHVPRAVPRRGRARAAVEAEGSMGTSFDTALGIFAAVAIVAGGGGLVLGGLSIRLPPRAVRRLPRQIR